VYVYDMANQDDTLLKALLEGVNPTTGENDLSGDDDYDDDYAGSGRDNPEARFEAELADAIDSEIGAQVETFESAGIMTRNRGLVVRTQYGKFQVSIVQA